MTGRVVVGRQAIYDTNGNVVAYELLFRGAVSAASGVSGDEMTAEVLYGALAIGFDHLVFGRDVFFNADRGVLVGSVPIGLDPQRTVVEVLESVDLDAEVVAGCQRLVDEGYRLALDDFVWRSGAEDVLRLASIVKIDVLQIQGRQLTELVERCRPYGVTLLAEKVEDDDQLNALRSDGFELFQGYALERPAVVSRASLEAGPLARVRMATAMLSADLSLEELEEIVRGDPALAVHLIQAASVGRLGETRRTIDSLRHALVLMGTRRARNWAALLLARSATQFERADRFVDTLIRARACELLAVRTDLDSGHLGFAAGMLSALQTQLDLSADELCDGGMLSDDLAGAAFRGIGPVGAVVCDVIDRELGGVSEGCRTKTDDETMHAVFADAISWSVERCLALEPTPKGGARSA